ncbi:tyrosine-type recombinase/integrase, partial [Streptomyces prasinosporus]|uniref:tyrosine-type recombinase/integrase n=1 Tax=Streptomyces prasinosporus TaxID=68256 RepID=UPI0031F1960B
MVPSTLARHARNFTRAFDRRCERAGVRRIRVHDTRHTCASLLAALDVHPRIAMQILRHSEIAVAMKVYTHACPPPTPAGRSASSVRHWAAALRRRQRPLTEFRKWPLTSV